jgi:hypothetical protein
MKSTKFDEHDRRKVITELEEHYGVKLYPVGARRKFLEDGEGKAFWVLGGYEDWHGIPPEMVEEEARRSRGGVLIVAKRYKNKIDVYSGPVRPLIENKDNLSHTKEGNYQFHIEILGGHLLIREIPGLSLTKLGETPHSFEEKDSDKKVQEVKDILDKLTPEERAEVLKKFYNDQET